MSNGFGEPVNRTLEYEAFDKLPKELRDALNYANDSYSAYEWYHLSSLPPVSRYLVSTMVLPELQESLGKHLRESANASSIIRIEREMGW